MTLEEDLTEQLSAEQLRQSLRTLQRQHLKLKDKQLALSEAAFDGAMSAVQSLGKPAKIVTPRYVAGAGKPEIALWHLTDWQGAKLTTTYSTPVMQQRVQRFVDTATKITAIQRADHPVDECVIAFGGDMIEGLFNFPTQPYEIDATLFEQYVTVARLIERTIRQAVAIYPVVKIVAEAGNHGRLGSKRDAVPKSDNADRMTYRLAEAFCADLADRVTWQDAPEDIQRLEVGNYRALVIHGDEFGRSGFASPSTIVRHCDRWRSGAYNWDFRDVYIGHYHVAQEHAMANGQGRVFFTGSTESDNRYARDGMSSVAIPSQRLHFIDGIKGRVTSQYHITLAEKAEIGIEHGAEGSLYRKVARRGKG